uniref:NERD domain-containing protein n=1 Tax=Arundo donax TaxID=35708 RepID=A0A0A8ZYP6_ARUDO
MRITQTLITSNGIWLSRTK